MSVNFGAASSDIRFSIGGAANIGNGAFTMLALWKLNGSNYSSGIVAGYNSTTERQAFLMDTGHLFGTGDFSSGYGTFSGTDWFWFGLSKPAGSAHYRGHIRDYTTAGAWSHGEAVGAANHTDPGTSDSIRIGSNSSTSAATGDVAVVAVFTSALADAAIETACTSALSDLIAASPVWAVAIKQSAPTSLLDLIGSGNETSRTGTITATTDPPSYNFTLGGGGAPKNGQFMVFF